VSASKILSCNDGKRLKWVGSTQACQWITVGALVTTAQLVTVVITLLVPIITAVAGILGVMFQDWRVQRSQAGRRRLALEDAHRQVMFATEWWNAKKLLAESPEAVREATTCAVAWLERASAGVPGPEMPVVIEKRRITLRRLLLFYPLQGISANIIRGMFYSLVAILILGVGATITDVLESPNYIVRDDLIYLTGLAAVALVLRFWAVSAQSPRGKTRKLLPRTFLSALLLYRLGGIWASLVRIVFYVYIVLAIWYLSYALSFWIDPKELPHDIGRIIAVAGLAVGIRHWAVSLGTARKADITRNQLSSAAAIKVADSSSATRPWPKVPDHYPDHKVPDGPLCSIFAA
jgi:hypothetical protein